MVAEYVCGDSSVDYPWKVPRFLFLHRVNRETTTRQVRSLWIDRSEMFQGERPSELARLWERWRCVRSSELWFRGPLHWWVHRSLAEVQRLLGGWGTAAISEEFSCLPAGHGSRLKCSWTSLKQECFLLDHGHGRECWWLFAVVERLDS